LAELEGKDVEGCWSVIKNRIQAAISKAVPKGVSRRSERKKWMDGGTLESVRKKHKLFSRWLKTRTGEDYTAYLKARNKASNACRRARRCLEKSVAEKSRNNPKAFWAYVKSKTTTRSGIADLKKDDGSRTKTDKEKADLLNEFFQSVFTVEDDGPVPDTQDYTFHEALND
jgi:hypothetical protein